MYYMDVTEIVATSLKTGIQAVSRNILAQLNDYNFEFIQFWQGKFCIVEKSRLFDVDKDFYQNRKQYRLIDLQRNDCVFISDINLNPQYLEAIENLIELGVDVRFFVHDVLPLTHKEYFPKTFSNDFLKYIKVVGRTSKFATSCEFTQSEILKVLRKSPITAANNLVMPIATNSRPIPAKRCCQKLIFPNKYCLTVSNYEPRKNQTSLLKGFSRIADQSDLNLVFVGGNSWMSDDIWRQLQDTKREFPGRIFTFKSLDDCCVSQLYVNATFTSYLSSVEGYGMPIIEAVTYGKNVLIANLAPMNQIVKSSLVVEVDPFDIEAIALKLVTLERFSIQEPEYGENTLPSWESSVRKLSDWIMYD